MFADSRSWTPCSSTLSWGHGRPTSFDHQERSPGASGRGSGRQLLLSSPASEQFEVEPDLRSSTSSDIEDRARPPTPERFKRYSLNQPIFFTRNRNWRRWRWMSLTSPESTSTTRSTFRPSTNENWRKSGAVTTRKTEERKKKKPNKCFSVSRNVLFHLFLFSPILPSIKKNRN